MHNSSLHQAGIVEVRTYGRIPLDKLQEVQTLESDESVISAPTPQHAGPPAGLRHSSRCKRARRTEVCVTRPEVTLEEDNSWRTAGRGGQ